MISGNDFIKQSLALHLFFGRIMKEHSFFLEAGFTAKDHILTEQADSYRMAFDAMMIDVVSLSDGVVNQDVLDSGEVITPYTLQAEKATIYYTGVPLATGITQAETNLYGGGMVNNPALGQLVHALNENAIRLVTGLIQFKTHLLSDVLSCRLFTNNYPLLIDHILREAKLYLATLQKLQSRADINLEQEAYEQEVFWNRIMAEHAKFIRGLLDPTENDLIMKANDFGNEFDALTAEATQAMNRTIPLSKVTADSLAATQQIRDFKTAGTQGLINCEIKSIIIPLLGDHVLRESNHFIRLLNMFSK
jgi:hypothetical protein